ncbi:hypothetical protein [Sulfobacillus harzensis]|uniref:Uncharacterized protein n=1 Tax=Sulfobacillus harzensis TaxID=2729629 RepID=A0A7Y0L5X6_9FIRM|nr:hypothetical protein [Sulfobacillus harzensis]NMP23800.1 hypothetical protein [Sulfobacillus harzensis]
MCEHGRQMGGREGFVCLDCGTRFPVQPVAPLTADQQAKVRAVLDLAQDRGMLTPAEAAHLWTVWEEATQR